MNGGDYGYLGINDNKPLALAPQGNVAAVARWRFYSQPLSRAVRLSTLFMDQLSPFFGTIVDSYLPSSGHPLPSAPHFVGREAELAELHHRWQTERAGVVALVGLGGTGKTAVAARFLQELQSGKASPQAERSFIWSFYHQPDSGLFLQEAFGYFCPGTSVALPGKGAGLLHLLREALQQGGPHLLVLDGLERVQCQDVGNRHGRIDDPLLRGLLTRAAEGLGATRVLLTSRFPLADLGPYQGKGYLHVDVGGLDGDAAITLLRRRGVRGDDETLLALVETYGAHALTLDHLGGVLGRFLDGDPSRLPQVSALADPAGDRQALRLARLLRAYEDHLTPAELALLGRLCLLRHGLRVDQVLQFLLCASPVSMRLARELEQAILAMHRAADYRTGSWVGLARSVRAVLETALLEGTIAGPEESLREELLRAAQTVLEMDAEDINVDVEELLRLYGAHFSEAPTALRPLPAEERKELAGLAVRYRELRNHPALPFQEPDLALVQAFAQLGWASSKLSKDLGPADVLTAFRRVRRWLRHFALQHMLLRRVHQLCELHRRKWSLAGPLAPLSAEELRRVLDNLTGLHLIVHEADGSLSVHPAVRDYFGRQVTREERGAWHDLVREQLLNLVHRPGKHCPEDQPTLDLVEEAIYHALEAGRVAEAHDLFQHVLGGARHLCWKLGEAPRCQRILRRFDPCPDPWGLAWSLRALGEFEEAYTLAGLPYFRADIRLLQGRLPEVVAEGDDARTAAARFLMGESAEVPTDLLSAAALRVQAFLYLGRLRKAEHAARLDRLYQERGWEGDRTRCLLLLAETARRQRDIDLCRQYLEAATPWTLHSGSVEHLCLYHLVRARASRVAGESTAAQNAVDEGLHVAVHGGLRVYLIELQCAQAEICLARADAVAAEQAAGAALERGLASDCRFLWGAGEAAHLLGQALLAAHSADRALPALKRALALRRQVGDPRAAETERLLDQLSS